MGHHVRVPCQTAHLLLRLKEKKEKIACVQFFLHCIWLGHGASLFTVMARYMSPALQMTIWNLFSQTLRASVNHSSRTVSPD